MNRDRLAHAAGDAINAILAAVRYNFKRLLAWLAPLCAFVLAASAAPCRSDQPSGAA